MQGEANRTTALSDFFAVRPLPAGLRPSRTAAATNLEGRHLSLLRDLQSIVDLGPEIADGALQFAMAKEKLDGPEISGLPVDQCRFGAAH